VQTDIRAEPLHQKILVPLGASIALAAAVVSAAAIALIVARPLELPQAVAEGSVAAVLSAIAALIVDAFWWLVSAL
jgi:hypothetical protein